MLSFLCYDKNSDSNSNNNSDNIYYQILLSLLIPTTIITTTTHGYIPPQHPPSSPPAAPAPTACRALSPASASWARIRAMAQWGVDMAAQGNKAHHTTRGANEGDAGEDGGVHMNCVLRSGPCPFKQQESATIKRVAFPHVTTQLQAAHPLMCLKPLIAAATAAPCAAGASTASGAAFGATENAELAHPLPPPQLLHLLGCSSPTSD